MLVSSRAAAGRGGNRKPKQTVRKLAAKPFILKNNAPANSGPRAVLGSQRVRPQQQRRTDLNVLSRRRPLRAEDGSRSVRPQKQGRTDLNGLSRRRSLRAEDGSRSVRPQQQPRTD